MAANVNHTTAMEFDSEGFDLSALGDAGDEVLELDGTVTKPPPTVPLPAPPVEATDKPLHTIKKEAGNKLFLAQDYPSALDTYRSAIAAAEALYCDTTPPFALGHDLVLLIEAHASWNRDRLARVRSHKETHERKCERLSAEAESNGAESADLPPPPPTDFDPSAADFPPPSPPTLPPLAQNLATYHCNAAACLSYMSRWEDCRAECDVAIAYDESYLKAYVRRAKAREQCLSVAGDGLAGWASGSGEESGLKEETGDIDGALADIKKAVELCSDKKQTNQLKKEEARLQKLVDAKMDKLKTETMGKLKDLGNSILGNFGLSMDNFATVQDPNTGGYSISFNNN